MYIIKPIFRKYFITFSNYIGVDLQGRRQWNLDDISVLFNLVVLSTNPCDHLP